MEELQRESTNAMSDRNRLEAELKNLS